MKQNVVGLRDKALLHIVHENEQNDVFQIYKESQT